MKEIMTILKIYVLFKKIMDYLILLKNAAKVKKKVKRQNRNLNLKDLGQKINE